MSRPSRRHPGPLLYLAKGKCGEILTNIMSLGHLLGLFGHVDDCVDMQGTFLAVAEGLVADPAPTTCLARNSSSFTPINAPSPQSLDIPLAVYIPAFTLYHLLLL